MITIENLLTQDGLKVAVASAADVRVLPSPEELTARIRSLVSDQAFPDEARRQAVRALLRRGGFKPSGRSKPASEYLLQAAEKGVFPFINNLVDINNYISLKSGLPASILDRRKFGASLLLRLGKAGESYVFNSVGHEIDLNGLIVACSGAGEPLGNPVKDSVAGKLSTETTEALVVVYAPKEVDDGELEALLEELRVLLSELAGASSVDTAIG